jgi:hypothetical protein
MTRERPKPTLGWLMPVDGSIAALAERLEVHRTRTTDSCFTVVRIGARWEYDTRAGRNAGGVASFGACVFAENSTPHAT